MDQERQDSKPDHNCGTIEIRTYGMFGKATGGPVGLGPEIPDRQDGTYMQRDHLRCSVVLT